MEDGVAWKGPGGKQFQRGTRTLVVVKDKFTLDMGNSFSEGRHVPKHQGADKNNQRRFYV